MTPPGAHVTCRASLAQPRATTPAPPLERLAELHASGAMTQEAYDREKRRLLDY